LTVGTPTNGSASPLRIAAGADRNSLWRPKPGIAPQPLSHHEILRLVEPFTRRGRHVDLAASSRAERRLVFKPVALTAEMLGYASATEVLGLENPRSDFYRLIRTLTLPSGIAATLSTEGPHPAELLARIEAVPPPRQFQSVADLVIAQSYRLEQSGGAQQMVLTWAEAQLQSLTLALHAETGKGYPAEIELLPPQDSVLDLPDDLLATLGWDWRVLRRRGSGWTGSLRLPRNEPERSRRIERRLQEAVAHLARTLAEPPRRFHQRFLRARWGVVFRRIIPLLACMALIAGTVALTLADIPQDSMILMMIFNFPPLLMLALFGMRELPRFEIPPLPRPSSAASWQPPTLTDAATTANVGPG